MRLRLLLLQVVLSLWLVDRAASAAISLPGCPETCGNVTIPYPFGIGSSCSANSSFTITCQNSTNGPQVPFLTSINMEVARIYLRGAITVNQPVSPMNCSDGERSLGESILGSPFTISPHYNTFVNLGCMNSVLLRANSTATTGGCMAICEPNTTDTSCNGVNCCQTIVPPDLQTLHYTYQTVQVSNRSTCGYAFLVDRAWLDNNYMMYRGLQNDFLNPFDQNFRDAPVVLDWEYLPVNDSGLVSSDGNYHCNFRGGGTASPEFDALYFDFHEYGSSIRQCLCFTDFEGNPYLAGGCQAINYCRTDCSIGNGVCKNVRGDMKCVYPVDKGKLMILIGVGSGLGVLLLIVAAWTSYKLIKKRIMANRRQKFFKRNGGLLLEQQLTSSQNQLEKTQLFGSKELEKATDYYNENRVLGGGGQGTVYKGMLTDGRIVAVKRSERVDENNSEDFINEVVILSQINHRNIVKLLGCCLETEVPILVYEFIPNGTLFQHIHEPSDDFPLSWDIRLRIAIEVAGALSYLHSSASTPIFHRDVKSTNIMLDDKYRAKVADFGTSRSVSVDKTHLTTRVFGTFGYLDPEYFQSSQFTDKSDVYSFGVLMVELLTGEKAISSVKAEVGRSLATQFLHSMQENVLIDILDEQVLKEGTKEAVFAAAEIAKRCLSLNGKRRPTMREVAVELEKLQIMNQGTIGEPREEDREFHTIDLADCYDLSAVPESMRFNNMTTDSFEAHPLISQ